MGECGGSGDGGRYEEKGGGQQVSSLFGEAAENEKITAIYGDYGFWSWLRYWWLDTENYTTFMLADKGYYDYDYSKPGEDYRTVKGEAKSDAELAERLMNAGFGIKRPTLTPEQLQAEVLAEEEKKRAMR